MEIIIGKTAGFCFGVANAVNKTKEQLKNKSGEDIVDADVNKQMKKRNEK